MKRLESIVEQLEEGTVPLETAITLYEEGVRISKECLERINRAELRIKFLLKDVDGAFGVHDDPDDSDADEEDA
jgi:exodeoxyribonuclease VII small subunit